MRQAVKLLSSQEEEFTDDRVADLIGCVKRWTTRSFRGDREEVPDDSRHFCMILLVEVDLLVALFRADAIAIAHAEKSFRDFLRNNVNACLHCAGWRHRSEHRSLRTTIHG